MNILHWQAVSGVALLLCFLFYGQARYWKAIARTIDEERDDDGWIEEAKFWRRHFDKDAAEWVEDQC